jgi:hypothetical protein
VATGKAVVYQDFSGGVHIESGTYQIADNQCQDCRNVVAIEGGALDKRRGFERLSEIKDATDPTPVQLLNSAHTLFPVNLASESLLAVGPVYSGGATDSIVKVSTAGVATSLKAGLTANTRWEFVQGPIATDETPDQGPIYGINGVDTPQYWDGASSATANWAASNGTVPSTAKFLIYHLDKFWASGCVNCSGRIWSTGLSDDATPLPDPCNWDTDYIDDVDPEDGQDITGLGTVGPYLLVFKDRKSYVLSDPVGRAYRTLSSNIGCSAHRSIVETTRGTLFLSEDLGVCLTDGSQIQQVSESILPLLREVANNQPTALRNAVATYHEESYYLSVPYNDNENSIILEFQLDTGAWWIHSAAAADFALLDPTGTPRLYAAGPGVNRIFRAFSPNIYTDDGETYESYWTGPYWTWGNPHLNKRVSQYRVDGLGVWEVFAAETFNDSYDRLDYNAWEQPAVGNELFGGTGNFGADDGTLFGPSLGVTQRRYPTPLRGWGRAWSLKLTDESNTNQMSIYSVAAFLRARTD